jgi:hypothetical protein
LSGLRDRFYKIVGTTLENVISSSDLAANYIDEMESKIQELEARIVSLEVNLSTCKSDYWFMTNLLERYSTNQGEAIKSCIERMKFRRPLFNILKE